MLAIKINDPWIEQRLAGIAKQQHKRRQTVVRDMLLKQIEDAEDYAVATAVMADIEAGRTTVISSEEMWRRLELDN